MVKNSEITRLARENLRGKWSFMVLVALIYYVVIGGASFTFIGNCLISVAMGVGFSSISLKIARKQETQLGDLFKIFLETFAFGDFCFFVVAFIDNPGNYRFV